MVSRTPGEIITFYSYKGGVGRSMALANVACLLARRYPGKILMIDWDLEAPGLHWFFQKRAAEADEPNPEFQHKIQDQPGLIDLFQDLDERLKAVDAEDAAEVLQQIDLQRYIISANVPTLPNLWLLKAGRFDDEYSQKVNGFDWVGFFDRSPRSFQYFAERLRQEYQYTLIDSRTGVTDTSGICTALMPEKLVTVFTPNQQSLTGVLQTAQKATDYRKQSDDLRPLLIYPLPSRVETSETTLRAQWRFGTSTFLGYQSRCEQLFQQIYALPSCSLENYFDDVQIQHFPRYSYGEEIAVLMELEGDRLSLTSSYVELTEQLITSSLPWETEGEGIKSIERSKEIRRRIEREVESSEEIRRREQQRLEIRRREQQSLRLQDLEALQYRREQQRLEERLREQQSLRLQDLEALQYNIHNSRHIQNDNNDNIVPVPPSQSSHSIKPEVHSAQSASFNGSSVIGVLSLLLVGMLAVWIPTQRSNNSNDNNWQNSNFVTSVLVSTFTVTAAATISYMFFIRNRR